MAEMPGTQISIIDPSIEPKENEIGGYECSQGYCKNGGRDGIRLYELHGADSSCAYCLTRGVVIQPECSMCGHLSDFRVLYFENIEPQSDMWYRLPSYLCEQCARDVKQHGEDNAAIIAKRKFEEEGVRCTDGMVDRIVKKTKVALDKLKVRE